MISQRVWPNRFGLRCAFCFRSIVQSLNKSKCIFDASCTRNPFRLPWLRRFLLQLLEHCVDSNDFPGASTHVAISDRVTGILLDLYDVSRIFSQHAEIRQNAALLHNGVCLCSRRVSRADATGWIASMVAASARCRCCSTSS